MHLFPRPRFDLRAAHRWTSFVLVLVASSKLLAMDLATVSVRRAVRIWCVVSQKGGSGKTTLLLHLSVLAMAKGLVVSVIDLDPQRSAEQWAELRERVIGADEPPIVHGTPA